MTASITLAEESEDPAGETRLEELTVVGTPVIEGVETDRYAGQKTSITEVQISDLGALDLSHALRRTPGVSITRFNQVGSFGGATGGSVFIRGMGSSRPGAEIKTLVDGVPMGMSVWNHPLLDLMSIDAAHSIEVYKGPQPHRFGNALGLVNIVPPRQRHEGSLARAQVAAGGHGLIVGNADHRGRRDRFDHLVGGGFSRSDGHRDHADGQLQNLYGRLGYRLSDHWQLSFFTLWNDNHATDPGPVGAAADVRQGRFETRAWLTLATLAHESDRARGHLKVYRTIGEGDWLDQPTSTPGLREDLFNDFLYYGVKAQETLQPWAGGEVIAGLDREVTSGEYDKLLSDGSRDPWDGHEFTITSPYLAVSHRLERTGGWYAVPSLGARYYHNSDFPSEWSPHAGLILGRGKTELHAGYARGVIYPGLEVVVFSEAVIPPLGDSWRDLEAETVHHYQVGLQHRFSTQATADLTWFQFDGRNRYGIIPPPPPPPVYSVVGEYRIRGLESTLNLDLADDLALFASLTYLSTEPSDLPYAPKISVSAGLNWRFLDRLRLSLDCQYVDRMHVDAQMRREGAENPSTVDSHFLVNARLGHAFTAPGNSLQGDLFLAVENLTDTNYEYLPGYPMPGITAMAGVSVRY